MKNIYSLKKSNIIQTTYVSLMIRYVDPSQRNPQQYLFIRFDSVDSEWSKNMKT